MPRKPARPCACVRRSDVEVGSKPPRDFFVGVDLCVDPFNHYWNLGAHIGAPPHIKLFILSGESFEEANEVEGRCMSFHF
jgi:hypothetical protein